MIPRIVKRRIRPMWLAAVASAAWVNRKDVMRWADFLRRAVRQRQSRPLAEWITKPRYVPLSRPIQCYDATRRWRILPSPMGSYT